MPVGGGAKALEKVHGFGVGADEDAGLAAFNTLEDASGSGFRRDCGELFEALDGLSPERFRRMSTKARAASDIGGDTAGMHARDENASACQFVTQDFGEATNGEFTRAVRGLTGRRDEAKDARHVHDVSAGLLLEEREKILDAIDGAPEIDVHEPAKVVEGNLMEGAEKSDTSVVDENGDALVAMRNVLREGLDGGFVRNVE